MDSGLGRMIILIGLLAFLGALMGCAAHPVGAPGTSALSGAAPSDPASPASARAR